MNEIMQVKPWGECLIISTQYYYYDYSYGSTVGDYLYLSVLLTSDHSCRILGRSLTVLGFPFHIVAVAYTS